MSIAPSDTLNGAQKARLAAVVAAGRALGGCAEGEDVLKVAEFILDAEPEPGEPLVKETITVGASRGFLEGARAGQLVRDRDGDPWVKLPNGRWSLLVTLVGRADGDGVQGVEIEDFDQWSPLIAI